MRRECVDYVVALGERHLRRILKSYASYHNSARTHRSLNMDAPVSRPIQQIGRIRSHAHGIMNCPINMFESRMLKGLGTRDQFDDFGRDFFLPKLTLSS